MAGARGFSLLEVVIAIGLTLLIVAAVLATVQPSHATFATGPEVADVQQRLRVAVDTLSRDLTMAGAGAYIGGHTGPLLSYFAPVLPFRQGLSHDDAVGTFRSDTITVISVPATAAQTTLGADLMPGALTLQATASPACPAGVNLCGFAAGMTVAVYDETGNVDLFTIASVADALAQLTITVRPADSSTTTYKAGSNVVEVRVDTYYLKADAASATFQLMHADGSANADVPVVDHLVRLAFEYSGEPAPPVLTSAGSASYGPSPPPLLTQTTAYPPGENCVFQVDAVTGLQVPRLASLSATTALTQLTAAQLTDGPWCPDAANANRWDADLLRIRSVSVTIRIEASLDVLRGPAGVLFTNGGTSRDASKWVADQEIRVQVSPRNMNLAR